MHGLPHKGGMDALLVLGHGCLPQLLDQPAMVKAPPSHVLLWDGKLQYALGVVHVAYDVTPELWRIYALKASCITAFQFEELYQKEIYKLKQRF